MRVFLTGISMAALAACAGGAASNDADTVTMAAKAVSMPLVPPMPSAPLDKSEPLTRITIGSCLKQEDDQSIWHRLRATDSDVFLFIGDNVYGDIWSRDPAMTELKDAYTELSRSDSFAQFRESTPMMVTWDDHDYGLNDAGGSFELKEGTEQLFEDAWALPPDDPRRARPGIYHSEIIGDEGRQIQIILLDTRYFRSDLKVTDERNAPGKERYLQDSDPSKTILGDAQYAWLAEELKKPADLRLIVSSIQVIAEGHGWEAWRTLPTDRQRFYDVIKSSGAEGVVFISGDRHAGAFYKTDNVGTGYPVYEMTSSSLNAPASKWRAQSGETRVEDGPNRLDTMVFDVNYGQIDIDWETQQVEMSLRGPDGGTYQEVSVNLSDLKR